MSPQRSFGAPVRGEHDGESPHSDAVVLAASPRAVTDDWGTFVRLVVVGADGSVGRGVRSRGPHGFALRQAPRCSPCTSSRTTTSSLGTSRSTRCGLGAAILRHDLETRWIEPLTAAGARHRCLLVEDDSAASGLLKRARTSMLISSSSARATTGLVTASLGESARESRTRRECRWSSFLPSGRARRLMSTSSESANDHLALRWTW